MLTFIGKPSKLYHMYTLRQYHREQRKQLSPSFRTYASKRICEFILTLTAYQKARTIALYDAIHEEVDVSMLLSTALHEEKLCYFPKMLSQERLLFLPVNAETTWRTNHYGIKEPDVDNTLAVSPHTIDLLCLPLVAVDIHGTRLGMGKGYYDRALETSRGAVLAGIAYACQRIPFIDRQPWDIALDVVITDQGIYWSIP